MPTAFEMDSWCDSFTIDYIHTAGIFEWKWGSGGWAMKLCV